MTNQQAHELVMLYIREKDLISPMDDIGQLAKVYGDCFKLLSDKYRELYSPSINHKPRKTGTVSPGIDID